MREGVKLHGPLPFELRGGGFSEEGSSRGNAQPPDDPLRSEFELRLVPPGYLQGTASLRMLLLPMASPERHGVEVPTAVVQVPVAARVD